MKKIKPYINFLNVDAEQKSLLYSNILSRKKNINNIFKELRKKLCERIKNNKDNEREL